MTSKQIHPELTQLIDQRLAKSSEVLEKIRDGLMLSRLVKPMGRTPAVYPTAICFLAQGSKVAYVGGRPHPYDANHFLLSTMSLPADSEVVAASREEPMLSVVLELDLRRLARVVGDVGHAHSGDDDELAGAALASIPVDPLLADALYRLVRTATHDEEWRSLGDGSLNEVYYRLATGKAGTLLRQRLALSGGMDQIGRAIKHIEEHLTEPLNVETVARLVGMSPSGFHAKFKETTSQSPMQFVKRLRLNSARNLLLEGSSATEAAFRVGYSSASQFSREFSRQYGFPPSKVTAVAS